MKILKMKNNVDIKILVDIKISHFSYPFKIIQLLLVMGFLEFN